MADKQMVDFLIGEFDAILDVRSITALDISEIRDRLYAKFPGRPPEEHREAIAEVVESLARRRS